jgi:hypothetical protein
MADDGYDPRFDPAFQRGFEGDAAFPPRQASTRPAPTQERVAPPPVDAPSQQQARVFAEAQSRQAGDEPRSARQRSEFDLDEPLERDRSEYVDDSPLRLRGNPFLIAALVLAVALIGGGVLIGSRIDAWYDDVRPGGIGYNVLNMLVMGAPLAVALGVATIIGVLFLFAVRWRGRSEE